MPCFSKATSYLLNNALNARIIKASTISTDPIHPADTFRVRNISTIALGILNPLILARARDADRLDGSTASARSR